MVVDTIFNFEGAWPKKSLKNLPFSETLKSKSSLLNMFQKDFFRNELHAPFLPYFKHYIFHMVYKTQGVPKIYFLIIFQKFIQK